MFKKQEYLSLLLSKAQIDVEFNISLIYQSWKLAIADELIFSLSSMPAKENPPQGEQCLVECQSKCGNWTVVRIPEKSPKRSFICGFCSYEQLAKLEQRLRDLEENSSTARQQLPKIKRQD